MKATERRSAARKNRTTARRKIDGPKTAKAAARAGHKKVEAKFEELSASATRAMTGERLNLVGTFREGPSLTPGMKKRCYFDPNTRNFDICYDVPK